MVKMRRRSFSRKRMKKRTKKRMTKQMKKQRSINRRKKQRSKKANKRKSYKQRGGMEAVLPPPVAINDYDIEAMSLSKIFLLQGARVYGVEYCGYFGIARYGDDGQYPLYKLLGGYNNPGKKTEDESRSLCRHKRFKESQQYAPYIWHTHPTGVKYYPSVEDIEKGFKHAEIEKSFIFVSSNDQHGGPKHLGMWVLTYTCEGEREFKKVEKDQIKSINDQFYHATGRGTVYNEAAIRAYRSMLNGIEGLQIDYYMFGVVKDSRLCVCYGKIVDGGIMDLKGDLRLSPTGAERLIQ